MGGYEYHAFVDFREILDDEFGTWGTLCYRLNGHGVPSIDEEVKQVRYAPANDALRAFLGKAVSVAQEPEADAQSLVAPLEPLLAALLKALLPQAKEKAQRTVLALFGTEMTRALDSTGIEVAREPHDWLLLCSFLALHRVEGLNGGGPAQLFDAFGLIRPALEAFQSLPPQETEQEPQLPPWESAALLRVLLKHESFLAECELSGTAEACLVLFEDPSVGGFLQLHDSGGVQWFNKERFELLLLWLQRVAPYAAGETSKNAGQSAELLVDAAAAAGYRVDAFFKVLETER